MRHADSVFKSCMCIYIYAKLNVVTKPTCVKWKTSNLLTNVIFEICIPLQGLKLLIHKSPLGATKLLVSISLIVCFSLWTKFWFNTIHPKSTYQITTKCTGFEGSYVHWTQSLENPYTSPIMQLLLACAYYILFKYIWTLLPFMYTNIHTHR